MNRQQKQQQRAWRLWGLISCMQLLVADCSFCPNSSEVDVTCVGRNILCEGNCGKIYGDIASGTLVMYCSCDAECLMYGDCCTDYQQVCTGTTLGRKGALVSRGQCLKTHWPNRNSRYLFLSDCSPDWTEETTRNLCLNKTGLLANYIPVTDMKTRLTYDNIYCALCNFANNISPWNSTARCHSDRANTTGEVLLRYLNQGRCKMVTMWPEADQNKINTINDTCHPRKCWSEISYCDKQCENDELVRKCSQPMQEPIHVQSSGWERFKNRYCARCYLGSISPPLYCGSQRISPPTIPLGRFSFSLLADFSLARCRAVSTTTGRREFVDCDGAFIGNNGSIPCNGSETEDTCVNGTRRVQHAFASLPFLDSAYSEWLGALSIGCVIASIICLGARVTLHPFISLFHNLGGRNQLSLSLAILIALVAFLVGPWLQSYETPCRISGVLMHWAFLASFVWMGVIAFDAWLVFRPASTLTLRSPAEQNRIFIRYSLFAWCLPLLVVAGGFVLDAVEVDSQFRPYYGVGVCWIAQKYALVVFFGVPLGLIIVVNSVLYAMTACSLHSSLKASSSMTSTAKEEHHFGVYVRLFLLMGATWATAYVATFVDSDIFWAVYTVLNASQGVFISLSSMCTKRVYQDLVGKKSGYSVKTPTTSVATGRSH